MKKVLYISPNGYLGGAERFVLTAVKAHKAGNNIDASILFFSDGEACEEAKEAGLKYFVLKTTFRFRYPWKLFSALMEIRNIVRKINPDILQLTMPYSHISLSLATLGLNIKKVWFQHGPVGGKLDQLANLFSVDVLLYNSLDVQIRHRKTWPHSRIKLKEMIVNYGINIPLQNHLIFQGPVVMLGTAGRICSWKGFHHILMALGELKKESNLKHFQFKIAGSVKMSSDQTYKNYLHDLVKTLNLTEEVKFLEHQKNMEQFYCGIDIFIHASVIPEPFGLVVAEAMANGCLVIASNQGGVADLIQSGINGFSFSATTDSAVAELKKILYTFLNTNNQGTAEVSIEMAAKGKAFVAKKYSVEQMCNQLEHLYYEIT